MTSYAKNLLKSIEAALNRPGRDRNFLPWSLQADQTLGQWFPSSTRQGRTVTLQTADGHSLTYDIANSGNRTRLKVDQEFPTELLKHIAERMTLVGPGVVQIAKLGFYCSLPITKSFTSQYIQLHPDLSYEPSNPNVHLHPGLITFRCVMSGHPHHDALNQCLVAKRITRLLNVLIVAQFTFTCNELAHHWVKGAGDPQAESAWMPLGYPFKGVVYSGGEFEDVPETLMMATEPAEVHWRAHVHQGLNSLVVPDGLDQFLDHVAHLSLDDAERLDKASLLFSTASEIGMRSMALVALVSAVEVLLDSKAEVCSLCWQRRSGIKNAFRDFMLEHRITNDPDRERVLNFISSVYDDRSSVLHGRHDYPDDVFYNIAMQRQPLMFFAFRNAVQQSIIHWILTRDRCKEPNSYILS